ncbi:carboxypeptidase N subunit 2-like [Pocillopora damicornis]|uniref:carboxypeptidase N subunit 2-like n=1 Tax=Pocillopora damicornis TaxID=46731 RepID=UPI000F5562AE|nr:carboxypeptidase N subunit 2-like [Pocillopora damicornis]
MLTGVIQVILVLCFVTPCRSDVCSQKICQCTKFGGTRQRVICRVHGYIPAGIPNNTVELDLSSCSLSSITEDIFRNLTVLKKLDLSNNLLRHIPQNTFRNMEELKVMNISDNLLSVADVKVILKGLTRLHKLYLDGNPLGPSLPADIFAGFENLTHLYYLHSSLRNKLDFKLNRKLQRNLITDLSRIVTSGIEEVYTLLLDNNKIDHLPPNIFQNTKVTVSLKINHNLLSIADVKAILKGLKQLHTLDLSGNPLGPSLPSDIFAGFKNMAYLSVTACNLQNIANGTFREMRYLNGLFLQRNELETIGDGTLKQFKHLDRCMIYNNKLTSVPDLTGPNSIINLLHLQQNRITDLSRIVKSGIGHVFQILLDNNEIDHLPPNIFQDIFVLGNL